DIPVPLGSTVPPPELVWSLGGGGLPRDPRSRLHLGLQERRVRVGLKSAAASTGFILFSVSLLNAAPVLRLSSATIGPILVPSAGVANTQTLEAYNAGDGTLNPSVSVPSSTPWVTARMGESRPCRMILAAVGKMCSTIQVNISTSGLPQGTSSTSLT